MIGGITKGSDFAGCVRYALALDEAGKEARLLHSEGVLTNTPQDIIDGFEVSAISTDGLDTGADTYLYPILRKTKNA